MVEEADTTGYVTRSEAEKILRCSRTKLTGYETEERLHRVKVDGRWHYAEQEVRELLEELDMERTADGSEEDPPGQQQTNIQIRQPGDPVAELMRAATSATQTANVGTRTILGFYKTALSTMATRVGALEGERTGMIERVEKLMDRTAEREIERKFAERLMDGAGGDVGEKLVDENLQPLINAMLDRVRGVHHAGAKDVVAKRVRDFFDMLSPEKIDAFIKLLSPTEGAVLMELIRFVRPPTAKGTAKAGNEAKETESTAA